MIRYLIAALALVAAPLSAQTVVLPNLTNPQGQPIRPEITVIANPDGTIGGGQTVWGPATGTIAGNGQAVQISAPGAASAVISVVGIFTGTLTVTGSADGATSAQGGRLLFKSGVGSIGTNQIIGDGTAMAREYRVAAGGQRIIVTGSGWTSGSVVVTITATAAPSILFVNGPVHTAEEQAVRANRAFQVSTGVQSVNAANFLNYTITNPTGSGVNIILIRRSFFNNSTGTPLEYQQRNNPTTVPATAVVPSNRFVGGPASQAVFRWEMSSTALIGGTAAAGGIIPNGGVALVIETKIILRPGQTLGYTQGGSGGGLAATARLAGGMAWYEESTN